MTPEQFIEEKENEWFKKIANQKRSEGFLHNGTRAIDEFTTASWLRATLKEAIEYGAGEAFTSLNLDNLKKEGAAEERKTILEMIDESNATMQWSKETKEYERTLVLGNLNRIRSLIEQRNV